MAMTVAARGTGGDTSSGTSTVITPGSDFGTGGLGVICIALDNAGAAGNAAAAPAGPITDTSGNIWTRRMNGWFDNGAASAGVEIAIYTANIGRFKTTDTVTLTWIAGVSVAAKAWTVYEVVPTSGFTPIFSAQAAGTGGTNTGGTVTSSSITSGDIIFGVAGLEGADSWTGDADSSNGSWQAQSHTGFGTGISGMSITSQFKIVTGTATQTYNPTCTSGDTMIGWASVTEVVNPFFKVTESSVDQRSDRGRLSTVAANSMIFANMALTLMAPAATGPDIFPPPLQVRPIYRVQTREFPPPNLLLNTLAVFPIGKQLDARPVYRVPSQDTRHQNLQTSTLAPAAAIPQGRQLDSRPAYRYPAQDTQRVNLLTNTLVAPAVDVFRELQITRFGRRYRAQDQNVPNLLLGSLYTPPVVLDIFRELQVTPIRYPKRRFQESDIHPNRLVPDFTTEYIDRVPYQGSQPGRRVKVRPPFDFQNTISLISTPNTKPHKQDDWRNPRIASRFQEAFNTPNLMESTLAPEVVTGTDIFPAPLQVRIPRSVRVQTDIPPNTISLVSLPNPKPYKNDDWPNPVRRKYAQPVHLDINVTINLPVDVQVVIINGSQPGRRIPRQQPFEFPNTISLVGAPNPKPYDQSDWQNPVRRSYAQPVDHIPNITILEPPEPPPTTGPPPTTPPPGGWRPHPPRGGKKKKKEQPAPWELKDRSEVTVRASLMAVVEANQKRAFDKLDRQDEEDIIRLMKKMGIL